MLKTLLTSDVIQVVSQAKDWRDAIAISCQPLIDNGAVEARYVEAIYRSHEAIGPYYVVGPGIAMPHARPEDGVNRLVLAATDSNSHIEAISQLAQLFDTDSDVQALLNAKTPQDILSVIARY